MRNLLVFALLVGVSLGGESSKVWPRPQSASFGTEISYLSPSSFQFQCTGSCSSVLTGAFQRYKGLIFFAGDTVDFKLDQEETITTVQVTASSAPPLALGVDESYQLTVSATSATISAKTEWGALRGIETFSQMVEWSAETGGYYIDTVPTQITDFPRFPWRGLLIDTSRHFLPLKAIFRQLDAMAFNKMNVLHWHVTDSQSFPIESDTFPLLSQKGAWSPRAVYRRKDVQAVINYAQSLGIRVMPEFDTPGHADSWGLGYPQLFPNCPGAAPVVDATSNYSYQFMGQFFSEMIKLFPDEFIHLGGDEVQFDCWQADPAVARWMAANKVPTYEDLQGYYEQKLQNIITSNGRVSAYWDEVFGNSLFPLDKNAVIFVWNQPDLEVADVVKAGYRAVYSTPWYLDRQVPDAQTFYLWQDTWIDFYQADPIGDNDLTPQQQQMVLGGEASMWGEQVDQFDIDVRTWPRASAVAERLWTSKSFNDTMEATPRLGRQRCIMVRRGISAGPIYPDYCELGN